MIITMEGAVTASVDILDTDMEEITRAISLMLQIQGWDKDTVSTYIGQDLECVSREDYDALQHIYDSSIKGNVDLQKKYDDIAAELFEARDLLTKYYTNSDL